MNRIKSREHHAMKGDGTITTDDINDIHDSDWLPAVTILAQIA